MPVRIGGMLRRAVHVWILLLALLFGQAAALAHDIGHFDAKSPAPAECDMHYAASQMGGGPLAAPLATVPELEAAPASSLLRQRDASIPVRAAYLSQAPPSVLR